VVTNITNSAGSRSSTLAVIAEPNTIFRGNSMASKAIDVYMKMIGMYLALVVPHGAFERT